MRVIEMGDQYDPDESRSSSMCGDYSIGAEPSNRITWATGDPAEPYITVDEYYYITARRDSDTSDLDHDDWQEALANSDEGNPIRYGVENMTLWTAHTDLLDVGGTELRSDVQYEIGSALFYSTLEYAEAEARRLAKGMSDDDYSPEFWR